MALLSTPFITSAGRALLLNLGPGAALELTSFKTTSEAYPAGTDFGGFESLPGIRQSAAVTSARIAGADAVLARALLSNEGLGEGYSLNTLGLYAKDPGAGEILFAAIRAEPADFFPPESAGPATVTISAELAVSTDGLSVVAAPNPAATATAQDVQEARAAIAAHVADEDSPHGIGALKTRVRERAWLEGDNNLLANGTFSLWSRGESFDSPPAGSPACDAWVALDAGMAISRQPDGEVRLGIGSGAVGQRVLMQQVPNPAAYIGRTLTFSVSALAPSAQTGCYIGIFRGGAPFATKYSYGPFDGALSATGTVPDGTAELSARIYFLSNGGSVGDYIALRWAKLELGGHATPYPPPPGGALWCGSATAIGQECAISTGRGFSSASQLADGLALSFYLGAEIGVPLIRVDSIGQGIPVAKADGTPESIGPGIVSVRYYSGNFCLDGRKGGEYGTAGAGQVLEGFTFGTDGGVESGAMPNRGAAGATLAQQGAQHAIPAGYHNGGGVVTADIAGLAAANVRAGADVGGVAGSFTGGATAAAGDILSGKTAGVEGAMVSGAMPSNGSQDATLTQQGQQKAIPAGYTTGGTVAADISGLAAANVKYGATVGGVAGTYSQRTGGEPLTGWALREGYRGFVDGGGEIAGALPYRGNAAVTLSGIEQTLGAGAYDSITIPAGVPLTQRQYLVFAGSVAATYSGTAGANNVIGLGAPYTVMAQMVCMSSFHAAPFASEWAPLASGAVFSASAPNQGAGGTTTVSLTIGAMSGVSTIAGTINWQVGTSSAATAQATLVLKTI